MNNETFNKILDINKTFYDEIAISFDQTRQYPWKGWERVLDTMQIIASNKKNVPIKILDIACGNGRFLKYISDVNSFRFEYVGIDMNSKLLDQAKELQKKLINQDLEQDNKYLESMKNAKFIQADVIGEIEQIQEQINKNGKILEEGGFDFVTAFGITHHIPSTEFRKKWLLKLKELLKDEGIVVITLWNYNIDNRFKPLQNKEITNKLKVDIKELEDGDYFLGWKNGEDYRYTHIYGVDEQRELVESSGLKTLEHFESDGKTGRTNKYLILSA